MGISFTYEVLYLKYYFVYCDKILFYCLVLKVLWNNGSSKRQSIEGCLCCVVSMVAGDLCIGTKK